MNIDVAFLLHAYQPWWQYPHVLERIVDECYGPNFSKLAELGLPMTLNVNATLITQLEDYPVVMDTLRGLASSDQVEFTGTAAYHPIMPLIADAQRDYQISVQESTLDEKLGVSRPRGFFLPEMAFSPDLAGYLSSKGYDWTVTDDPPFKAKHGAHHVPFGRVITMADLNIFLRSHLWSFVKIARDNLTPAGDLYKQQLAHGMYQWTRGQDAYVVVAMDFETFDHQKKMPGRFFDHFFERFLGSTERSTSVRGHPVRVRPRTLSEIADKYRSHPHDVPPGSWSTDEHQYRSGNYFPLWASTDGHSWIHQQMWQLYGLMVCAPLEEKTKAMAATSCDFWHIPMGNAKLASHFLNHVLRSLHEVYGQDHATYQKGLRIVKGVQKVYPDIPISAPHSKNTYSPQAP